MDRTELLAYLAFALEHRYVLQITGRSGKVSTILVDEYGFTKLIGRFYPSNQKMSYWYENILSCRFKKPNEQAEFDEERFLQSTYGDKAAIVKRRIALFKDYYQRLHLQCASEKTDTESEYDIDSLTERAIQRFEKIFKYIYTDEEGLFLQYLLAAPVNEGCSPDELPILLLSRSNYSQKQAIERALQDNVSIIEGPPGTGKTTTILSILANLVVRGKHVVVVSKNNSAIDNIKEELDKLNLPPFYLRLGRKKIMDELEKDIKEIVKDASRRMAELPDTADEADSLFSLYHQLKELEADINLLVETKNQLLEDKNMLRHLEKRREAFQERRTFYNITKFQKKSLDSMRREINRIAASLQQLDAKGRCTLWNRLKNSFIWKLSAEEFGSEALLLQFQLEYIYLTREIEQLSNKLEHAGLEAKQDKLAQLYDNQYILSSLHYLQTYLSQFSASVSYRSAVNAILFCDDNTVMYACRKELRELFPVILTTADSLVYNFKDLLDNGDKIDCIIMDEASQCDLLTGIPVLHMAKRCVVVGDQKQLSAIVGEPGTALPVVEEGYDYYSETFLSSVKKVWNLPATLLREHYRCDYAIINYCNKFYYNNELIIYTEADENAIQILKVDQGKYADIRNRSFCNEREIKSIEGYTGSMLKDAFVITPFKAQAKELQEHFKASEKICGTIHTFQGRGEDTVYFSTVLNDLSFANAHLSGNHCLFYGELFNVAVSRAKKRFVLVSDIHYLRRKNGEARNLIEYIETYGQEIPDKTVCLFDGLYRKMKAYAPHDKLDNVFEEKVFRLLEVYCQKHPEYYLLAKLPLANVVTDKTYLDEHPEMRSYLLHGNTHLDFTLCNAINHPILVIELDGQYHKKQDQMQRDEKKNAALKHMQIPLWRISSKAALTEEEFNAQIDMLTGIEKSMA